MKHRKKNNVQHSQISSWNGMFDREQKAFDTYWRNTKFSVLDTTSHHSAKKLCTMKDFGVRFSRFVRQV